MSQRKRIPFQHPDSPTDIVAQVVLPFDKSLEISLKSIKSRFLRNMVTVTSLILAVSFFAYVLIGSDISSGIYNSGQHDLIKILDKTGYQPGGSAKERWIVILSLLVCTVGIINAQLMAVTERFREIGTMKCLGALDSFVLRLFVLEASMQGVVGSLLGALFGGLIAILLAMTSFGWGAVTFLPVAEVGISILYSIGVGFGLSLIGVLYPAMIAARMRPIEAMRVEE
ncbi:ABC transporter permease [Maridesulfovibrio ferrireducens]|uniref:ABC transporter permease n=1 Tax=Maridesulfovibrio ferrireducens TaxID=246191 RepID=UPI001A33DCCD|nr:FtsX-like permease family protein [Maridesulfovibrio ferrireducens]MBI9110360.1 FtsX-like permease family protein [Maridesulfovibrio ferrireducens]